MFFKSGSTNTDDERALNHALDELPLLSELPTGILA
jgi:hypothetical protein